MLIIPMCLASTMMDRGNISGVANSKSRRYPISGKNLAVTGYRRVSYIGMRVAESLAKQHPVDRLIGLDEKELIYEIDPALPAMQEQIKM